MILMNHFQAEPEALRQEQRVAVERVLGSGVYVLGPEVKQFEQEWAQTCQVDFAVGVGNGMDAIEIGLRSLGIGAGDEVITTPMTAFATVLAILRAGATPVLADIDPATALLDRRSAERCLSPRTKAVLLVHLYGQVKDLDQWATWCDRQQLHLLEDCAQAHLASWQGRKAGSFGTWGAYSFYPTKNLGAIGDGGALITQEAAIAAQAQILRNYGQTQRYHHPELGLNSRLDELQAALLSVKLRWLATFTTRRQQIAQAYRQGILNPHVELLAPPKATENHVYHLFVLRCRQRERLQEFLQQQGIQTLSHYPIPIHHQAPCRQLTTDPQGLPQAEAHAQTCLSLPCHPQISDRDLNRVIEVINAFA